MEQGILAPHQLHIQLAAIQALVHATCTHMNVATVTALLGVSMLVCGTIVWSIKITA